jgi:hypothetical protein
MFWMIVSLIGCMPNVLPSADGVHSVVLMTDNKQEGTSYAMRQGKRYCKKKEKKQFYVKDQLISYVCEMDEQKYIRAKKAAAAAEMAGVATSTASNEDSNGELVGDILASAGAITDATLGDCYEVKLHFVCK